jgi:hypothetical protein
MVLVNNIIHGFLAFQTVSTGNNAEGWAHEPSQASIVGNRYIANSATCAAQAYKIDVVNAVPGNQLYHADNSLDTIPGCAHVPREMYIYPTDAGVCTGPDGSCLLYDPTVDMPPSEAPLPSAHGWAPRPSNASMESFVLANVGARPTDRDSAERRILNDVATRTWRSVHTVTDAGGWPPLANNTRSLPIPSNPHALGGCGSVGTRLECWLEAEASALETEAVPASDLKAPTGLRLDTSGD